MMLSQRHAMANGRLGASAALSSSTAKAAEQAPLYEKRLQSVDSVLPRGQLRLRSYPDAGSWVVIADKAQALLRFQRGGDPMALHLVTAVVAQEFILVGGLDAF